MHNGSGGAQSFVEGPLPSVPTAGASVLGGAGAVMNGMVGAGGAASAVAPAAPASPATVCLGLASVVLLPFIVLLSSD